MSDLKKGSQLVRFLVTGAVVNLAALAVFQLWIFIGVIPEIAVLLTTFPAIAASYMINRIWSFGQGMAIGSKKTVLSYFAINLSAGLIQSLLVSVQYRVFGIAPLIALIVAILLTTIAVFETSRRFVFADR